MFPEGQLACFRNLPTDTRLSVYITVFDEDRRYMHHVAIRNETWINFTSSQRKLLCTTVFSYYTIFLYTAGNNIPPNDGMFMFL